MPERNQQNLFTAAPLPVAKLNPSEQLNCLRLIRSGNVGPVSFRTLINEFRSAADALIALPELARRGGARQPQICAVEKAEAELEAATKIGASPIFTIEPGYPAALAATDVPPPMLYVKGKPELLNRPTAAIVGSRQSSAAGATLTRNFAIELGKASFVIASGLARGIDSQAHSASLTTGTIAVLAGGLDHVYPPENQKLMNQISEVGCLISEQPPGFRARASDFPRRNRIISGLSLAVIIVEAAARSGTLVTARHAAEQGREVFAVPGNPLDPRAEGTNNLIRNGATLVTCAADIIDALNPVAGMSEVPTRPFDARPTEGVAQDAGPNLSALRDADREKIWDVLGPAPAGLDAIVQATDLPARIVQAALLEFDLAGKLTRPAPGLVAKKP